jgi:retinol dehydrogenase-12
VYVVTGSNTGVGLELITILYSKNAQVYIAARSKDKSLKAIESISERDPESKGALEFLYLDLADLTKTKGIQSICQRISRQRESTGCSLQQCWSSA